MACAHVEKKRRYVAKTAMQFIVNEHHVQVCSVVQWETFIFRRDKQKDPPPPKHNAK